ncbi:YicC/YloC family endoribonuclease [Desulfonatronum thioautotrophicum]|uniref:YicC/YloC family endoribonuclease n=1 Tax=Desulfonatronum thioautotrophicum TaxID=617001 RepID=UPI0005EB3019|nr:YicC/YloC family endoribonuclease [Desulfonatronum thioautotrophicum]
MTIPVSGQVRSMTGFGSISFQDDYGCQNWEVRTVNSRYLEVKWRIPGYCRRLEHAWEKVVRSRLARGRVDISLDLRLSRPDVVCPTLDIIQAQGILNQIRELAGKADLPFQPDLNQLVHQTSLWRDPAGDLPKAMVQSLGTGLLMVLDDVQEFRSREGCILRDDILARLERMQRIVTEIQEQVGQRAPRRLEMLRERVNTLLQDIKIGSDGASLVLDEPRLLQEIALIADRQDVSEELTRLSAHLEESVRILTELADSGRRLDFLFQECLREIATCGNKVQDADLSRDVVAFKAELEKCREQVQNLE